MLDVVATLLSYFLITLFPLFSVYKLLRASRISAVPLSADTFTPWLTFYAVLSVFTLFEALVLGPFTAFIPLYAWLRLLFYAFLLLPEPQGASYLWTGFVNPFLEEHEADIEDHVARVTDEIRVRGGRVAEFIINWVQVHLLGRERVEAVPPPPGYAGYAQSLLSRFYGSSIPVRAMPGNSAAFYSSVMSILQSATSSPSAHASAPTMPGSIPDSLLPPELASAPPADRLRYIHQAQQGLSALLQAFARQEAQDMAASQHVASGAALTKSKSEAEFDTIEKDEADREERMPPRRQASAGGGWMPWHWSGKPLDSQGKKDESEPEDTMEDIRPSAKSSGVDL